MGCTSSEQKQTQQDVEIGDWKRIRQRVNLGFCPWRNSLITRDRIWRKEFTHKLPLVICYSLLLKRDENGSCVVDLPIKIIKDGDFHFQSQCSILLDGLFSNSSTHWFFGIVHIDTQRPLQLCYTFIHFCSMLHLCSVLFSYAAVLDLHDSGQNMFRTTCSYLVRCVAFNASCMQHRGSAGSGRFSAIPDSQGLGASHLNGVLCWKKSVSRCRAVCWKLVPWELPEVSASYMSDRH